MLVRSPAPRNGMRLERVRKKLTMSEWIDNVCRLPIPDILRKLCTYLRDVMSVFQLKYSSDARGKLPTYVNCYI